MSRGGRPGRLFVVAAFVDPQSSDVLYGDEGIYRR